LAVGIGSVRPGNASAGLGISTFLRMNNMDTSQRANSGAGGLAASDTPHQRPTIAAGMTASAASASI
jgi:hypothetical protein